MLGKLRGRLMVAMAAGSILFLGGETALAKSATGYIESTRGMDPYFGPKLMIILSLTFAFSTYRLSRINKKTK